VSKHDDINIIRPRTQGHRLWLAAAGKIAGSAILQWRTKRIIAHLNCDLKGDQRSETIFLYGKEMMLNNQNNKKTKKQKKTKIY
jgi:hypothetical protein